MATGQRRSPGTPSAAPSAAPSAPPTTFLQRLSEEERTELMADIGRLRPEDGGGGGGGGGGGEEAVSAAGEPRPDAAAGSPGAASSAHGGSGGKPRADLGPAGPGRRCSDEEAQGDASVSPLALARLRVQSQSLSQDVADLQEDLQEATSTLADSEIRLRQQAEQHQLRLSRSEQRHSERIAELEYRLEEAQRTYSKLAAASEAIASDNVELSGRIDVLNDEREHQAGVIREHEENIAQLRRLYLAQQDLGADQQMTTTQIQLGILQRGETRVPPAGEGQRSGLEKFFADIATRGELHSFLSRSEPPADFDGPSAVDASIRIHGNSVIQRLTHERDGLRASLLESEKRNKQLHTRLAAALDERRGWQTEQKRAAARYESVIVGSLRRIAWLLKREEELRERERGKDAYVKKIEAKLLRLHEAVNAGSRSQAGSPASARRRPGGARAQWDLQATASAKRAAARRGTPAPRRDAAADGKMSKLMRGDWDAQMRESFDVEVDLERELAAHRQEHHLAAAAAVGDVAGDAADALDGSEQPLTISEVRNFTLQLEALHKRNVANL